MVRFSATQTLLEMCTNFFEIPLYLKCTIAFLRGSLILEAYNVPLIFVAFIYHSCFTFGVDLYVNAFNEERVEERKTENKKRYVVALQGMR